jgi:hypothetical protein
MIFFLFASFILIWLIGSLAVDRVIEYQHVHYYNEWINSGKPRGMFFNPKGSSYFIKWWRSEVPDWMAGDIKALSLHKKAELWMQITKYYLISFFPIMLLIFSLRS